MRFYEDWSGQSACRSAEDPDAFFVRVCDLEGSLADRRAEVRRRQGAAKALCGACPVMGQCLESAYQRYQTDPVVHGIAGGLNQREQRALFRQRRKQEVKRRSSRAA